jgi:RecG-like helicase
MRDRGNGDLVEGNATVVSARVRIADIRVEGSFRRRVQRTVAVLEDETGTIDATWFGRRFIERRLHPGDRVIVSGKLKHFGRKLTLDNPDFQAEGQDDELLHVGRIVPVYRLTAGLTANRLRIAMRDLLDRAGKEYPEYLPTAIREGEEVVGIGQALEEAHYPVSFEGRDGALRRLAFDELLALQLGMVARRRQRGRDAARPVAVADTDDARLRAALEGSLRGSWATRSRSRRTRTRRFATSATISRARRRCFASSKATSDRGRRPWRPTRSRLRHGPGCRAPSSPRPTSLPGSTTGRWPRCSRTRPSPSSC